MSLLSRFRNVFGGRAVNRDIDEELQSHFEEAKAAGRKNARARLSLREAVHDVVVIPWLASLVADARFGLRQIRKHRTAAGAAILSLGLGIGACTAAFRLIDALILRPLPVAEPDRLYVLGSERTDERGQVQVGYSFDYPGFRELRAAVQDDAAMMAISYPQRINLTYSSDEAMERVYLQNVSGNTFSEFGLRPALGRLLTESDDQRPGEHPYAVLSYDYWSSRFGKDPGAIGRKFRSGSSYEIVGVLPQGFTGTEPGTFTDIYVPTMMYREDALSNSGWHWFNPWVRVKPHAKPEEVRQKLGVAMVAHRQEQLKSWPVGAPQKQRDAFLAARVVLDSAAMGASDMQREYRRPLTILGVLVGLVLLIACVNVANLMTAQSAARAREMALRVSIGAGRARLIQLVMVESLWIAAAATLLGSVFAWWAAPFVAGMINPIDSPVRLHMPADWRVTSFAAVLTLLVTMLFGIVPALRASGVKPVSALKGGDDARSRRRLMHALVAAQVAFCVLVQLVGGLFVATFERLSHQPLGFSPARVITVESVTKTPQPVNVWYQVTEHLRSVPGVEAASLASFALMSGAGWNGYVWANGHSPEGTPSPWFLGVSPGWMDTMKLALLGGRDFLPGEVHPKVAIVNQAFARRFFDGQNPVGRTFETLGKNQRVSIQIVGLAADARYTGMRGRIPATIYVPFRKVTDKGEEPENWATFMVRTKDADPMSLAATLRQEVTRARPEVRAANFRTQDELVRSQTVRERLLAVLSIFFSAVALVLASVGLYGVLNYAVTQRRRELGIRIALGAGAPDIVRRVGLRVLAMIGLGMGAGLALGVAMERYFAGLLFGVKATDLSMLLWPAGAIFTAAALAALPAVLRAIRIDPARLLRAE